jgi:hypothetical protein
LDDHRAQPVRHQLLQLRGDPHALLLHGELGALGAVALRLLRLRAQLGLEHHAAAQRTSGDDGKAEDEGDPDEVGGALPADFDGQRQDHGGDQQDQRVAHAARLGVAADRIEEKQQPHERRGAVLGHVTVQERLEDGRDREDHGGDEGVAAAEGQAREGEDGCRDRDSPVVALRVQVRELHDGHGDERDRDGRVDPERIDRTETVAR